jgi:LDH2 family malate/lactate/ureidoglycolate dehydrogenase
MFDPSDRPSWHNAGFIVLDAQSIGDETFGRRLRELIDEIHAAPTADNVQQVWLRGEQEWIQYHHATAEGITLPDESPGS